jgi:hypothetical protein
MNPNDPVLQLWQGILGTVPEAEKLGQLASLNDVPESVVAAARRLESRRKATGFISSYLQPERRRFVEQFVHEVVFGDVPPQLWSRGRTLVPAWSFVEQVTLSPDALVAPLGGTFSHRLIPSRVLWEAGVSWVGAPSVPKPDADYLYPIPEHAAGLGSEAQSEPVADPGIALRRWIAARIASVVRSRVGADFSQAEEVASSFVPIGDWTPDARFALQGLLRESRDMPSDLPMPFGFRGPDDWFAATR